MRTLGISIIFIVGICLSALAKDCTTYYEPFIKLVEESEMIIRIEPDATEETNRITKVIKGDCARTFFLSGHAKGLLEEKVVAGYAFFLDQQTMAGAVNTWINFTDQEMAAQFEQRIQKLMKIISTTDEVKKADWLIEGLQSRNPKFDENKAWPIIRTQQELEDLWTYDACYSAYLLDQPLSETQEKQVFAKISNTQQPNPNFYQLAFYLKVEKAYPLAVAALYQQHLNKSVNSQIETYERLLLANELPPRLSEQHARLLIYHLKTNFPITKKAYPISYVWNYLPLKQKVQQRLEYVQKVVKTDSFDQLVEDWRSHCEKEDDDISIANQLLEDIIDEAARLLSVCANERIIRLTGKESVWDCF